MNLKLILTALVMYSFLGVVSAQNLDSETKPVPQKLAEIFVEESTFEFGMIDQGEVIQNVFEITNLGEEPLVISNAKGSCGCTVPNWPKEPIMPGESAQILVKFNSKGKKGKQSKRVTLTANTEPAQTFLTIKGEILNPEVIGEPEDPIIVDKTELNKNVINSRSDVNSYVIYPNPTAEVLNVALKDFKGESAEIQIFNQMGKLMESRSITAIKSKAYSFDVSNYPSGTYVISTKVKDMMRVAKQISIVK